MKEKKMFGKGGKRLAFNCRVFLSFCMGDTLSTDGQWLHWIVLERERERGKRKKNNKNAMREKEREGGRKI